MKCDVLPLLSVIIPCYNVEKYINEAVESVLQQDYHNIELILVDDGSIDRTGKICDDYASLDSRVRVIHQQNCGQGAARNIGLSVCNGEYITFVDSDDKVSREVYSENLLLLDKSNADVLQFPFCRWYEDDVIETFDCGVERLIKDPVVLLKEFAQTGKLRSYFPNKIFRKSILLGLSFEKDMYFEDRHLMVSVIEKTKGVLFSVSGLYYYRTRIGSITQMSLNAKLCKSQIKADLRTIELARHYKKTQDIILEKYSNCIYYYKQLKKLSSSFPNAESEEMRKQVPTLSEIIFSGVSFGLKVHIFLNKLLLSGSR